MRIDKYLAENFTKHSRATWQKFLKSGQVLVNGKIVDNKYEVDEKNDEISFNLPVKSDFSAMELPVIYEDENILVIDKPVGILTHSKGELNDEFTVADFIASKRDGKNATNRDGIVHRLDRATSGVIITAKNDETARLLQKQFADRKTHKTYIAVLSKIPKQLEAKIDAPIGRNPKHPSQFRVDAKGKYAITHYKVLATNDAGEALVELKPETGRTHQLRVHMDFIGTPIKGDPVYGKKIDDRMYLHAKELEITVPTSRREIFTAPVPDEFFAGFKNAK